MTRAWCGSSPRAPTSANELRLRLFLLDRPMLGRQVEAWCKPGIDSGWLDPCTLRNEVLPHFIGVEAAGNSPDPCPRCWGLIRGERDVVPVPDSVLVLPKAAAITCSNGGDLDALADRYGERLGDLRRAADDEIKEEIEQVRAAARGARHPAYMHAAARIEGLCAFWCIPLDRPRKLLERAYLDPYGR